MIVLPPPSKPEPLDARLSFDLPSSLRARVESLAAERGTSMAAVLRDATAAYFNGRK